MQTDRIDDEADGTPPRHRMARAAGQDRAQESILDGHHGCATAAGDGATAPRGGRGAPDAHRIVWTGPSRGDAPAGQRKDATQARSQPEAPVIDEEPPGFPGGSVVRRVGLDQFRPAVLASVAAEFALPVMAEMVFCHCT